MSNRSKVFLNQLKKIVKEKDKQKTISIINKRSKPPIVIEGNLENNNFFDNFARTLARLNLAILRHSESSLYRINNIPIWIGDRIDQQTLSGLDKVFCCNYIPRKHKCIPLIYFPYKYDELLSLRTASKDRNIEVSWCGSQYRKRVRKNYDLVQYCDWSLTVHNSNEMIPFEEYIDILKSSRFSLSLPGFGPKCHKDIEAMAVGTVLAFTPGSCHRYFNKLVEGKHYIIVKNEEDIRRLKEMPNEQWQMMSKNCTKWFNDNIAPEGAYNVIMRATERFKD